MQDEERQEQTADELMDDPDFLEVGTQAAGSSDNDDDVVDATFIEPFTLVKERFTLSSINARGEKHGDERVPALDLSFKSNLSNSVLLKLHPDLRDALYVRDRQTDIEADYGRKLKFPLIGTIPYDLEVPRVRLRVHDCDSEQNDVVLFDGTANKFKITPMEGGSVGIAFRVQFSDYDTDVLAALARVLMQTVPISLACEAEEEKGDNFDQVETVTEAPKSAARLAAEDLFNQLPEDRGDTDAALAVITGAAEVGEQAHDAGIAEAEVEAGQQESNVTPIKAPRKRRTAGGAE